MKKNTVLSLVAILLCFMVGYVAYESTLLLRTWIADKFSDCKQSRNANCSESAERPVPNPY
jgi:hypothetical protein